MYKAHHTFGTLLAVEMSKKCTPLWREARFQVKSVKNWGGSDHFLTFGQVDAVVARSAFPSQNAQSTPHVRTTFGSCDVENARACEARSTFPSQNVQSTTRTDHFWRFRCGFAWQGQGIVNLTKSEQNVRVVWQFQLQPPIQYNTLHYTTLHYTALHHNTLHYTPPHYTPVHYATLHCATLHYTYNNNHNYNYANVHYTTLDYTTLDYTT